MNQEETQKDNQDREDHYQVVASQKMIRGMREEVTNLGVMMKEVRDAIKGNDMGQEGVLKRVDRMEEMTELMTIRIDAIELAGKERRLAEEKRTFFVNWIWGLVGAIASAVLTSILYYIFKK